MFFFCFFSASFGWYFSVTLICDWKISPKRGRKKNIRIIQIITKEQFRKVQSIIFHIGWDCQVSFWCFCPFIIHTQGSLYYWHGGSLKVLHFIFNFYFQVSLFTDFIAFFGWYYAATDTSIRRHVFFLLLSLTTIFALYFSIWFYGKVQLNSVSFCFCYYSGWYLSYLPTPPLEQDMTQGQFLSGVYQVWIQFSFS